MDWRETALHQVSDRAGAGIFVVSAYAQQVEVLFHIAGGYDPGSNYWGWIAAISQGTATLGDLAQAMMGTPGYWAHMGQLGSGDFVRELYTNAVGVTPDQATVNFWAQTLDSGAYTRPQFMELIAWNISVPNSYVYHAPEGQAFGNPW